MARAIVAIGARPDSTGAYHLTQAAPPSWSHVLDWMARRGHRFERTGFDDWKRRLLARLEGNALAVFEGYLGELRADHVTLPRYDCRRTVQALEGSGLVCPAADDRLLDLYFQRFEADGFLPPPPDPA